MMSVLLLGHIGVSFLTIILALLPLAGATRLEKYFLHSYCLTALSGLGLGVLSHAGITASCVRFVVVLSSILLVRLAAQSFAKSS